MSESAQPRWIGRLVVDIVQHDLITTHGGLPGLRDETALESALARPKQAWSFGVTTDVATLAAAYAFGIAQGHPFNDGNKRIAFVTAAVFAELNGFELLAPEPEVVDVMLRLASGGVPEAELADWLRAHLHALPEGNSR